MAIISVVMLLSLNLVPCSASDPSLPIIAPPPCSGVLLFNGRGNNVALPGPGKFDHDKLKALGFDDKVGLEDIDFVGRENGQVCEVVAYTEADLTGSSATVTGKTPFWSQIPKEAQADACDCLGCYNTKEGMCYTTAEYPDMEQGPCESDKHVWCATEAGKIPVVKTGSYGKGLKIKSVELLHKPPLSCEGDAGASKRFDMFMCTSHMCTKCALAWCTEHCQKMQNQFPGCRCNHWPKARTSFSDGDFAGKGQFGDAGDYANTIKADDKV